jgi:hypothetical protein
LIACGMRRVRPRHARRSRMSSPDHPHEHPVGASRASVRQTAESRGRCPPAAQRGSGAAQYGSPPQPTVDDPASQGVRIAPRRLVDRVRNDVLNTWGIAVRHFVLLAYISGGPQPSVASRGLAARDSPPHLQGHNDPGPSR